MFDKKLTTDERIDALAELMVTKFHEVKTGFTAVETRLEKIEFNTSGQDRRISILEDKMRIVSTKLGLA